MHHVLPSPRMRALKGMWRSVAAGEGEGLDVATHLGAIGAAIQEDSGTKTEVSHDGGFISALHRGLLFGRGKNSQVSASPNSRATHDSWLPRGIPRFSCQDLPWGLYYFGPLSTAFAQQAGLSKSVECCPRYIGGSSDCWRLAFPTPFPDSWRAFKVRPRSYFGRLSSSSRKSNTDIVRIPSLS